MNVNSFLPDQTERLLCLFPRTRLKITECQTEFDQSVQNRGLWNKTQFEQLVANQFQDIVFAYV